MPEPGRPESPDAELTPGGSVSEVPRPTPGERRFLWWLTGAVLVAHLVALYLPGTPDGGLELPAFPGADKVVHALLFAVPVYLLGRLTGRVWLWAAIFAAHAVASEVVQWRFVAYRDGDPRDALADLVGIGLAVFLLRRRSRLAEPLA
ncbi:MAG: hypothetical protein WAL91_00480 [Propionicimonas sp.]